MCPHRSEDGQERVSFSSASRSFVAKLGEDGTEISLHDPTPGKKEAWPLRQKGVSWGKAMDHFYVQPCTEHKDALS